MYKWNLFIRKVYYYEKNTEIYNKFFYCKQIKKDKISELGISEFLVKKYSNKETPKMYSAIDNPAVE